MEGPAFSTKAESLMHRLWGGDLIGMTAMPEAKLAREAEISYALLALVTDYDCWKPHPVPPPGPDGVQHLPDPFVLLQEIIGHMNAATENAIVLLEKAIARMAEQRETLLAAGSRQSLKLAIWSDKTKIDPAEVEKMKPLWGRYF
jgi:5'-methylthioadenosine phosphorylase